MIHIKPLASGSAGNCYYITDGRSPLLIEVGIPIKKIKQGLNYKLSEIEGCLISHEHLDHCKAVEDIMTAGIDCYISKQTAEAIGITGHRIKEITPRHRYSIGSWVAKAFKTEHDVPSFGFLLWSMETKEKLVYITDSMYSRYVFPKMDYIMVECNYSKKILDRNVTAGKIHPGQKNRIIQTHFGLENVIDFLRANDLSRVKEIHLLHLSDRNSSANCFKKEIQSLTGKPVYIAGERKT